MTLTADSSCNPALSMLVSVSVPMEEETTTPPAQAEPTSPPPPYERCDCLRCGHRWKARNPHSRPTSCPRCGSSLWDKPPVRKTARRPDDPPNPHWRYRLKPIKRKCPTCHRPMSRLTVAERKALEEKERKRQEEHEASAIEAVVERPARPSAINISLAHAQSLRDQPVPRRMTPPPSLNSPAPPPMRPHQPETPEVEASRRGTLSEELKEKS